MAKEGRGLIVILLKTFLNSLKPRKYSGNYIGSDYLGTKYYEIPANPSLGKRRPSRWFEPKVKDEFEQELPAEWEAWLRGRRKDPPQESEILKNLAIMQQKKKNALELEANCSKTDDKSVLEKEAKGMESFPVRKEYEIMPGKSQQGN